LRRPVASGVPFQETASLNVDRTVDEATEQDLPAVLTFAIAAAPLVFSPAITGKATPRCPLSS
jgi:hypothetical protein